MFHGTRQFEKIAPTAWAGFHLSMFTAFVVAIPVFIFRNEIGWLFSDSANVSAVVATVIIPLIIYQVPDGLQCVFSNSLRGLSNVKPLVLVAFLSYFVTSLPLAYFFGITLKGGLVGVWYSFPIGLTVAGALYYYFFRRTLKSICS